MVRNQKVGVFFMFTSPLSFFHRNEESCAPWTADLSGTKALLCWGLLRLWGAGPDIDILIYFPRAGLVLSLWGDAQLAVPPQGGEGTQRGQGWMGLTQPREHPGNPAGIPNQHSRELLLGQMCCCNPALAKDIKLSLPSEHWSSSPPRCSSVCSDFKYMNMHGYGGKGKNPSLSVVLHKAIA